MKKIESAQNPTFKMLKSLTSSKGIKKEGLFLAAGQHILKEVEQSGLNFKKIHFQESTSPDYLLSKDLFQEISNLNSQEPICLLTTKDIPKVNLSTEPEGVEVLLPVGDPKNLGALIRTCQAFSVKKIILLQESANPFLPDVIKSSSGAILTAPLYLGPSIKDLDDPKIYSLDKTGAPIKECGLQGKSIRLLLGEEGGHIPQSLSKNFLSIPISNNVESLNVNSCLSIALYELS
ncbi:MAG: TrmH family RNA methyltransferase [Bdellovibrionales bacterium]